MWKDKKNKKKICPITSSILAFNSFVILSFFINVSLRISFELSLLEWLQLQDERAFVSQVQMWVHVLTTPTQWHLLVQEPEHELMCVVKNSDLYLNKVMQINKKEFRINRINEINPASNCSSYPELNEWKI